MHYENLKMSQIMPLTYEKMNLTFLFLKPRHIRLHPSTTLHVGKK